LIPPKASAKNGSGQSTPTYAKERYQLNRQCTIQFEANGYKLTGTLHLPDKKHKPPVVIGCHGLFANRDSPKQISLAQACNNKGLAYLRFDHRGCGESQGEFYEVTSLPARCHDLHQAVAAMQDHPLVGKLAALFGSSFGGTVALAYAARHQVPAVITYAAPSNSSAIQHANIRDNRGNRPHTSLLTEALAFDIVPTLKSVSNILVAHCQNDETVPVDHALRIHAHVAWPKELQIFPGGDHRMSDPEHQQQFETLFIQWLEKQF
jgi:pimeloyl-ACP methyl ester carboxylesterase